MDRRKTDWLSDPHGTGARKESWLTDPPPTRVTGGMLRTREGSFRDGVGFLVLLGVTIGLVIAGVLLAIVS